MPDQIQSPRRRWAARTGVLAAAGLVLAACTAVPRDPVNLFDPTGHGGTGTGGAPTTALVGSWRALIVFTVDGDLQSWVTVWRFEAGGACHFRRETTSVVEGITRVRERDCTWIATGGTLTATFTDTGEVYPMPWSFRPTGTTVLILEGVEYQRLPS